MEREPDAGLLIEHAHPSLRVDEAALEKLVHHVLEAEGRPLRYLTVVLADHEMVLDLNRAYLDHDYLTDVLSFPLGEDDGGAVDGEIYVDLDTAQERHQEFGATFDGEVRRYVVHGLLHLLGYEDASPEAKDRMHALEDRYLGEANRSGFEAGW